MKNKLAKKMLKEKLDFLPLKESIELLNSGEIIETQFHWVVDVADLDEDFIDNETDMFRIVEEAENIYGINSEYLRVGKGYNEFDEFTFKLAPAPTYIDLIK